MMELGKVFLPRKSVNVLFSAIHAKHGIAWTDGSCVFVTPIYAKHGSSGPLKLGEFSSVRSLQWSRDVGRRLCYLSVVCQNEVTLWTVKGKWPDLTVDLACKLYAAPINNGCLWHPITDIICILSSHRAKLHFHHELDTRGSYTLPQIQSGQITCGAWSIDGLKLVVVYNETVVVYSWPGDSAGIGDHEVSSWTVPGLCGCLVSIVALDNNTFASASEMRVTFNSTDQDYLSLPQSPPPKLIRVTGGEGDIVKPRSSHLGLSEKLLNLQKKDLTNDSSSLVVFTTAPECKKITSLNISGILKPDLLCYNGKSKILLVGSNHYRKLKLYSFKTDQLSHYADIDVGEAGRPRGVCSSQNPLGFFSAIASSQEDSGAFLPSGKGIQCDLTVKFHALKAEEKKPKKAQRTADTKSRTIPEHLPKKPLIEEISEDGQHNNKIAGSHSRQMLDESKTKVKSPYTEVPEPVMVESDNEDNSVVNLGLVHSSLEPPSDESRASSLNLSHDESFAAAEYFESDKMHELENGNALNLERHTETFDESPGNDVVVDEEVVAAESLSVNLEPPSGFTNHTATSTAYPNEDSLEQTLERACDDIPNSITNGHIVNNGSVEEVYPAESACVNLEPPAGFTNDTKNTSSSKSYSRLSDRLNERFRSKIEILLETQPVNSSSLGALGKETSSLSEELKDEVDEQSLGEVSDISDHSDCTGEMKVDEGDGENHSEAHPQVETDFDEMYQAYEDGQNETVGEGSLLDDLAAKYSELEEVQEDEDVREADNGALLSAPVEKMDGDDCAVKSCDTFRPTVQVDLGKPDIPSALHENTSPVIDPKISLVFPEVSKSPIRPYNPRRTLMEKMADRLSLGTYTEGCSNPELVERLSCHLNNKEIPADTESSCTEDELDVSKDADSERENFHGDEKVNGIEEVIPYQDDVPHPEEAPGKGESLETGHQDIDLPVDSDGKEKKLGIVDNIKRPFLKLRHVFDDHGDEEQDVSSLSVNEELALCFDDYDIIDSDDELLKEPTLDDNNDKDEENPFFSESQQTEIAIPDGQRSPSVADRIKGFFSLRKNSALVHSNSLGSDDEDESMQAKSDDHLDGVTTSDEDNNEISADKECDNQLNSESNPEDTAIESALTHGGDHASDDECDIAESKETKKPSIRKKFVDFFSFGKENPKNGTSDSGAESSGLETGSPEDASMSNCGSPELDGTSSAHHTPTEVEVHQLQSQVDIQKQHLEQLKAQIFRLTRALKESECRQCAKHSSIYKDPDTVTIVCHLGEESLEKEFALDNGQINLAEVKMAFKMDTIEIMKGHGSFVVGADKGGFIPIQFPPGATIHIQDHSEC